jgi:hypothetical protein
MALSTALSEALATFAACMDASVIERKDAFEEGRILTSSHDDSLEVEKGLKKV